MYESVGVLYMPLLFFFNTELLQYLDIFFQSAPVLFPWLNSCKLIFTA